MKTDDLILALSADARPGLRVAQRLWRGLPVALAVSGVALLMVWGTRPGLVAVLTSAAGLKTVLPLVLAALAGVLALSLSRPEARGRGVPAVALWGFGAAVVAAFGAALVAGGLSGLITALATPSLLVCLASIPALSAPLLWAVLWALSAGAPRRPALSGALGGLMAAGLATVIYSFYCDQDAMLFFLPAYSVAVVSVAAAGGVIGARTLAW